ncbi:hypothetical protein [Nannocystis sp. SCPEA4]|uniref:hypothetical protein n=1 Tax=Nannocystis sp. SCPEA4 TaxID=2996787 RepID=UPI00227198FD|nr:hypothetical protein [Nannocystis sp. SCPEA4]MCY1062824.1 hypothetical protein [Nannocystis sp. SCPEA4]
MRRPLLLFAAVLCACAPSQRRLLAGRHYPEAFAGVREGDLDGGAVLAQLAVDLEPALHLQAVPAAELRARIPGNPLDLDDVVLVRAIHDSHQVTLPNYRVTLEPRRDGRPLAPVDTSIAALAARTREALPETRTVAHAAQPRYVLDLKTRFPLLELFARIPLSIVTLGGIPLVRNVGTPAYTEVIEPGADDYARASPGAEALRRWIADPYCDGPGERCRQWLLWPRSEGPLEIVVVVRPDGLSSAELIYRLPLPEGPFEDAVRARFGADMQPLAALARAAGTTPQVRYSLTNPVRWDGTLDPKDARALCRTIRGTFRRPGLLGRPGLVFTINASDRAIDLERAPLTLRDALLACGAAPEQIEVVPWSESLIHLSVRHDLAAR